ncbi:TetR/AcrR family transcriptional regulator [Pediococcus pentosaceus]|uniref:TetR/AcrR family transcriptional regulator n=1 Tax=Pediococcus pentosaceus TaxID=1255 RepID=UPI00223BA45B|nr:TetR/AcrR family transcriptional regulator [Pediococcus pentosaceus]MCS8562833.1 TetR/AcrR family transcriptional regulator [Pediococcus pentosaceus]MCS8567048.1 TetR/AcrR family transcriptional regulator [Pediococcus pentosaceus]MCS8579911.1 TetR/AcrR family transcriptional regulator [Pediococcus pentosaceus]
MKEDPRIIKTLSKLQKAFVMLLKTYDAGDINVRQISDEAGVTRGAFYSHFSDKKEFVNFTINELVGSLFNSSLKDSVGFVDEVNHKNAHGTDVLSVSNFFDKVAADYQTYTIVLDTEKLPQFTEVLKERLNSEIKTFAEYYGKKVKHDGFPIEVLSSYYVNGLIGMIRMWLDEGMVYTSHYMANAAKKILGTKIQIDSQNIDLSDFFVD